MAKPIKFLSKTHGIFAREFERYLLEHFADINVQKINYNDRETISSGNLVIAEYFPGCIKKPDKPRDLLEVVDTAREIGSRDNIVFILQPWGRYSHSDIPEGLAGVIYRLDNRDFEGFAPDGKVQPAHELLQKYF